MNVVLASTESYVLLTELYNLQVSTFLSKVSDILHTSHPDNSNTSDKK